MSFNESSAVLVGDSVYWSAAEGGLWVFSRRNFQWNLLDTYLHGLRRWHVAELVHEKIYYFGETSMQKIIEYDIVLESTREIAGFKESPLGREFMSAVFAPWRKEIVTFGGFLRRGGRSNETHGFNVESRSWTKLKLRGKPPEPRTVHAATLCGTKMYIFGGFTTGDRLLGDLWVAELGKFSVPYWSRPQIEGPTPTPRSLAALNNLNGVLVLFGGYLRERAQTAQTDLDIYLEEEQKWHNRLGSKVEVLGISPGKTAQHLGVTTSEGILYFTPSGIFMLSRR